MSPKAEKVPWEGDWERHSLGLVLLSVCAIFSCFHVSDVRSNSFLASEAESGGYRRKDGRGKSKKSPQKPELYMKKKDMMLSCGFGILCFQHQPSWGGWELRMCLTSSYGTGGKFIERSTEIQRRAWVVFSIWGNCKQSHEPTLFSVSWPPRKPHAQSSLEPGERKAWEMMPAEGESLLIHLAPCHHKLSFLILCEPQQGSVSWPGRGPASLLCCLDSPLALCLKIAGKRLREEAKSMQKMHHDMFGAQKHPVDQGCLGSLQLVLLLSYSRGDSGPQQHKEVAFSPFSPLLKKYSSTVEKPILFLIR